MNRQRLKAFLSVGLAALMASVPLTTGLLAAALTDPWESDGWRYENRNLNTTYVADHHSSNLLAGQKPYSIQQQLEENGAWTDGDAALFTGDRQAVWTDGKIGQKQAIVKEEGKYFRSRLSYELAESKAINEILIEGSFETEEDNRGANWVNDYTIYISDSKDTLYQDSSKKIYLDNASKGWTHNWSVYCLDEAGVQGQYIGIEMYSQYGGVYIDELGVYAAAPSTPPEEKDYTVVTTGLDAAYISGKQDSNLLSGKRFEAQKMDGTAADTLTAHDENQYWTDGQIGRDSIGLNNLPENGVPYRFIYELDQDSTISEFLIIGMNKGNGGPTGGIDDGSWHKYYKIYVADEKSALFSGEPVISITNGGGSGDNAYNYNYNFSFQYAEGKMPQGRYIALETQGYYGNAIYMDEFAVYGTAKEETDPPTPPEEKDYTLESGHTNPTYETADNLLHGNTQPVAVKWNDGSDATSIGIGFYERWTDGKFEKGTVDDKKGQIDTGGKTSLRVAYDLKSVTDLSKVIFVGTDNGYHGGSEVHDGCWHGGLKLFVSADKDTLFQDANKVADIDNSGSGENWSRVFSVAYNEGKHPEGRYIGFEVTTAYNVVFIEELIVFGTEKEGTDTPTPPAPEKNYDVANGGLSAAYINAKKDKNLLVGLKPISATQQNGTRWEDLGDQFTDAERAAWTDNTIGRKDAGIKLTDSGRPCRFVYQLPQSADIKEIMIKSGTNIEAGREANWHENYRIFVSATEDVFADENEIVRVNNTASGEDAYNWKYDFAFRCKGDDKWTGQYIGFEIKGGGGGIWLDELAAYTTAEVPSLDVEIYDNYTVNKVVSEADVSRKADQNLLLGLEPALTNDGGFAGSYLNGNQWNLVDGQIYQQGHIDYASPNGDNEPMRFTYDLLQTVPIDQFLIVHYYYPWGDANFTSNEYELYVSNDKSTLYEAENRVIHYDNRGNHDPAIPHSGTQQLFTFTKDKPVGRYVGVRMVNLSAADNTGRLDQLAIYSEGKLPVDAAAAQTFEDKDTGIKVSVLRKRADDLFDLASSLRVTKRALSSEEQVAADSVHFKLLGSAYQLELLDKSGNVLNDAALGGRIIKIELPMPDKDGANNKRLCCIADGKLEQLPYTIFDEEYAVAFLRGSLGTLAIFQDTLKDMAVGGAADVNLSDGMSGIGDGGSNNNAGAVPTGVAASMLILLPPAALAVLGISRKRRGTGGNKK